MYSIAFFADFHLKAHDEDYERALALIAHSLSREVDAEHVVIGGDLVECADMALMEAFLDDLADLGLRRPGSLSLVPGNHDIFPLSKRVRPRLSRPTANWERFCALARPALRGKGCKRLLPGEPYPVGKVLGDQVVLAALDSTRNRQYLPFRWASGELLPEHMEAVGKFFERHSDKSHRVVVMHHNPWEEESESKLFPMPMARPLPDTACDWLADTGATLLLCGHFHDVSEADLGDGTLQGFCAGTAGGVDDRHGIRRYHVFRLRRRGVVRVEDYAFDEEEVDEMAEELYP